MVRVPAPSPRSAIVVVLAAVFAIGFGLGSSNPTLIGTTASPAPTLTATASLTASATPTPAPTSQPTRAPTCDLPPALPPAPESVATPTVKSSASMIFESPFYGRLGVAAFPGNPGLWFSSGGSAAPRLLAGIPESKDGRMVVPLALSPRGDTAAVWWQGERYLEDGTSCPAGIYLVSTATGYSILRTSGIWSGWAVGPDNACPSGSEDERGEPSRLRGASFSADGQWLAVVECARIRIFGPDLGEPPIEHLGGCDQWAWSPAASPSTRFVASCEEMTSAWFVDTQGGTTSIALPLPSGGFGWGYAGPEARAIGLTSAGRIRVVRFFGAAIGCEEGGSSCSIPPLRYAATTIDPSDTRATPVTRSAVIDFLVDGTRLAPDASWVYVRNYGEAGARIVNLDTGKIMAVKPIGSAAGTPADGRRLFGTDIGGTGDRVVVWSLDAGGTRREVATVSWPTGIAPEGGAPGAIDVIGLQVATPS